MADEKEYQVTRTFVNEDDKLDAGPALTLSRVDEITNELHDDKRVLHDATNMLHIRMVIATAARRRPLRWRRHVARAPGLGPVSGSGPLRVHSAGGGDRLRSRVLTDCLHRAASNSARGAPVCDRLVAA